MPQTLIPLRSIGQLTVIVTLLISSPEQLDAQGPVASATQSSLRRCTYETCAIRLDRSLFGGRRVNVGLDVISSPMGLVGGGLMTAVDAVPLARDEVMMGRRNAIRSAIVGVIGALALAYSLQGTRGDALEWNDGQVFGGLIVGGVATVAAVQQSIYADRHYSRAVWLYNRELPR